jgi:hypothetical protein
MKLNLHRISALLALGIGLMAVIAGGQVLLGRVPDYYVIGWLPIYNFAMGILSVLVTAILIWRKSSYAIPAALITFGTHSLVMLTLFLGYGDVVAKDSLMAMTIRISVWLIILGLLFIEAGQRKIVNA